MGIFKLFKPKRVTAIFCVCFLLIQTAGCGNDVSEKSSAVTEKPNVTVSASVSKTEGVPAGTTEKEPAEAPETEPEKEPEKAPEKLPEEFLEDEPEDRGEPLDPASYHALDLSKYDDYGFAYGGVIPVCKNGKWGAVDYEGNVIVQLQYDDFRAPNRKGYSVFINGSYDDITSCLYDNKGNLITSHNGYMVANSDVYVTTDSVNYGKDDPDKAFWEDYYSTTHNYYSYDGSLLVYVESGFSERHVAPPTGFYNGKAVVTGHIKTPVYKQSDIHTGVHPYEFGFINTKGKTIWKDGDGFDDTDTALFMDYASGLAAQEAEQAKQQDYYYGGAGGANKMNEVHSVISTLNHGYFLTQGVWEDGIALRNESGEMVARLAPWYFGINSENELIYSSMQYMPYDDERYVWSYSGYSGYYSDYYGFWHDGEWIYNYGPKLVIRTSEKAALIDFTFNKDDYEPKYTVFDYCALADENYWLIKQGDNWGYCDHDGNVVKLFEGAGSFNNGIAPVVHDGQAFIVNESFEDLNNLGTATKVNTLGELIEVYNGKTVTFYVP